MEGRAQSQILKLEELANSNGIDAALEKDLKVFMNVMELREKLRQAEHLKKSEATLGKMYSVWKTCASVVLHHTQDRSVGHGQAEQMFQVFELILQEPAMTDLSQRTAQSLARDVDTLKLLALKIAKIKDGAMELQRTHTVDDEVKEAARRSCLHGLFREMRDE